MPTATELVTRPVAPPDRSAVRDRWAVGAAVALVVVAAVVGGQLVAHGVVIHAGAAPLFARWDPVLTAGSVLAVTVGAALVAGGPVAAARWRWAVLLPAAALGTAAWTVALALVRGAAGLTEPLTAPSEYLADLPRIAGIGPWLAHFTESIPAGSPMPWRTHVSGHPPGMTLVFVVLDRTGLGGPGPAAAACVLGWVVAVVATAAATRSLAGEPAARAALPYLVTLPAAIWAGVSADALLAGTGAVATYLLCRKEIGASLAAGVLFGWACFLSYGALLLALPALAVVLTRGRPARRVAAVVVGALTVFIAFHAAGFDWWEGYRAVRGRYFAGYGGTRPYAYWVWADFAALAVAAGPAIVVGLRRTVVARTGVRPLVLGALAAVVFAAATGLSKAEVERIWLPWTVLIAVSAARLPAGRRWLAAQVVTALLVEHLLRTPW